MGESSKNIEKRPNSDNDSDEVEDAAATVDVVYRNAIPRNNNNNGFGYPLPNNNDDLDDVFGEGPVNDGSLYDIDIDMIWETFNGKERT